MSETPKKKTTPKTAPRKTASKKRESLPAESSYAPTHHEVELLAYRFWVDRGSRHGDDAQDWLRAEKQLKTQ